MPERTVQRPVPRGLSSEEARKRLRATGPNEPIPARRTHRFASVLRLFGNPLVLILLFASLISATVGEVIDAIIIAVIVLLSAVINGYQSWRAENAVEDLRDRVAPRASVLRDDDWTTIPRHDVVPGDIIRVSAGDLIPADARLLDADDLHVQEAALTGESMPAEKTADPAAEVAVSRSTADPAAETSRAGRAPASTAKTSVAGQAPATEEADRARHIYLGTSVVSGWGVAQVDATGPGTVFGGVARRLSTRPPESEFEHGLRQFGLFITRVVIFLVLFLVVVSIVLRRDPLTSLLFALALAVGLTPEFLPMITTVTLSRGALAMSREKVIVRRLASIQNFGSIDILCCDKTGTLTRGEMTVAAAVDVWNRPSDRVFTLAWLNSHFESGIRSPLDAAILERQPPADSEGYIKLDEIPFDFERRRLSVAVRRGEERLLICKGAPESVLPACSAVDDQGREVSFDAAARTRTEALFEELGTHGIRVLAVASRALPDATAYTSQDETDLTLNGFMGFADPPIDDAHELLDDLKRDGVRVQILTGDNERVARYVCSRVGLDTSSIVLGTEVDGMDDPALGHVAERTAVFARVSPSQKNRIILALKNRGHVVGYLGDGINDAPSLHTADVGISTANATDVAREAADVVLVERSLLVLHRGILEGRKAFGNVTKYVLMGTSSAFGNMFSMAAAALFLPFLPMLPTQILLNNFLYDLAQVTIPTDHVDEAYLRKPRRWGIRMIRNFMLTLGPVSSVFDFLTFGILLYVFKATETLFRTGWFVESLATQTLVLFVIRTGGNPLKSRASKPLTVTVLTIVCIGTVLPFTPLARMLGFTPLPLAFFAFLVPAVAVYLVAAEYAKRWAMSRDTRRSARVQDSAHPRPAAG